MSKSIDYLKSAVNKDHVAYGNFTLLLETLSTIIELPNGFDFFIFKTGFKNEDDEIIYLDVNGSPNLGITMSITTECYTILIEDREKFETIIHMKLPIVMKESLIPAFNYILDKNDIQNLE